MTGQRAHALPLKTSREGVTSARTAGTALRRDTEARGVMFIEHNGFCDSHAELVD